MAKLTNFKALSFDVYGTLIDWETGILDNLEPLLEANNARFSREKLLHVLHECERSQQAVTPNLEYNELLTSIHPQIAEKLGLPKPSSGQSRAFGASVGSWPAFPDTVEALRKLGNYYKLVVLSNVDHESFSRTNDGPLSGVKFDLVITAQDVGSYKPDVQNFQHMIRKVDEQLGITKEQILHTAQSQFHDHHPASKIGIHSSWIVRPGSIMGNMSDTVYDWKFDTLGDMADAVALR